MSLTSKLHKPDSQISRFFIENFPARDAEADLWNEIEALKNEFSRQTVMDIHIDSMEKALARAKSLIFTVLGTLASKGISPKNADPGHGIGHMVRDYVHAFGLVPNTVDATPQDVFVGLIGGVLHDIGCAVVERYQEPTRVIRHAEVGALMVGDILSALGVPETERLAIMYAIAAHTNYLKESEVLCEDGKVRRITPYKDSDEHGPIMAVQFPRWVDRLDLIGPTIVGRHLLTLTHPHKDYGAGGFYEVEFEQHLIPSLRPLTEIMASNKPVTMLEHLATVAELGGGITPYNQYDRSPMVEVRDQHRAATKRIIDAVLHGDAGAGDPSYAWWNFLRRNIEPSTNGGKAASIIELEFAALPKDVRVAWTRGFIATMEEYKRWFEDTRSLRFDPEIPFLGDVYSVLTPVF